MTEAGENMTDEAAVGAASTAAPATSEPVHSTTTQQWLDAALAAIERFEVDEAFRRRVAQRIF